MRKNENGLQWIVAETAQKKLHFPWGAWVVCAVLTVGFCLLLTAAFPSVPYPWWAMTAAAILVQAALLIVYQTKIGNWLVPAGIGVLLLLSLALNKFVLPGFGTLANDFLTLLTKKTGKIYLDLAAADAQFLPLAVTVLLLALSLLLSRSAWGGRLLLALPILLPCYAALLLDLFPIGIGGGLLIIGTVLLLVQRTTAGEALAGAPAQLILPVLCAALCLLIGLSCQDKLNTDMVETMQTQLHQRRYDSDTNSMPEGNLKNLPAWNKSDTPALEVTMEQPEKVYLRGQIYDTYTALLFVPGQTPYDYYTKEYEKGLALYASGVMIMEKCADLLPDYFSFIKGVVDSEDLSLNISRETLQKDGQVKLIRNSLEKKIKNELHAMLVNDREKYETFWKAFGRQIKFGIYGDYGMHKDLLSDLLMFYSAKEQKLITLDEYIEKMPEGQKAIYFAAGDEAARLGKLPNAQLVLSKGYDLLLCSEDVDEFCLQIMHDYKEKEFKNINSGDLGLETEDEKKAAEETATENKDLFEEIKKALNGKIKDVKVNPTLQDHPVSLSSEGGISMEMEKILRKMPAGGEGMESTKVLELNPNHAVFGALKAAHEAGDTDKINKYAELLYDQALLIEGLPLEDPVAYAQLVCDLMK